MAITWTLEGALKKTTETERKRSLRDMNLSISTTEEAMFVLPIPTGTPNQEIVTGFDNAQMVAIFTDHEITVQLSSGGTPIVVNQCLILMGTEVDELFISNDSGNTANVQIMIGGDVPPTP